MMKRISNKWKYLLASLLLANNIACSNDDLIQMVSRQEQDSGTRTAELVSKTITLDTAGTLEAKVSEAMGDAKVATLEKLVLSGPFTSTDMQFVRDSLTGLKVLDMEGAQIKASDVAYKYDSWSESVFEDNMICYRMFYNMDGLKEVALPVAVVTMDDYAFCDCDSLRSVSLPDSLESIGSYAFSSCDSLSVVTLPSKLKTISGGAFENCYSLKEIVLPESLETLGGSAFRECKKISSIKIPGKVKTVENFCFYGCDSMAEIVFSEGVETIGDHSFAGSHQVKTLDFPASLRTISGNAFYSCNSLQMITIPETVTSVGSHFVRDCPNLRAVVWKAALDVPSCSGVYDCLLFVYTDRIGVSYMGDWANIIINDFAESSIDINSGSSFANAKEFTAKKLTYSRYFGNETTPGGSSGWQTIVLPFTPDSIYHETKGQIAPFNSGIEGAKPFWLRELTSKGFVDVTTIEPNKPYIIAMPNHSDYIDEYRLSGTITFVARDSVLRVTPDELTPSVGPEFELHPTYRYMGIDSSSDIYTLTEEWGYYEEEDKYYYKSFFKKNEWWTSVEQFYAYVTTLGGGRSSRSMFDLDTRSKETRAAWQRNTTGIPQIGDM